MILPRLLTAIAASLGLHFAASAAAPQQSDDITPHARVGHFWSFDQSQTMDQHVRPPVRPAPRTETMRFRMVSIKDRDDMIGGEACSFLAPADWKVQGGIQWRLHPAMPAGLACRIYDPRGLTAVECFPALPYSWGSHLAATGFRIGSTYLGNEVQPPPNDAKEYLTRLFLPRMRGNVRASIVKKEALPDFARLVKQMEYPDVAGVRIDVTAACVRLEYSVGGKVVEEDVYAVIAITRLNPNNLFWIADHLAAFRAEKGRLDEKAPIFLTMIKTARVNPRWFSAYADLVRALSRAQVDHLRKIGEIGREIARNASQMREQNQRDWEARQARMDRLNENYSRYQRGVELFNDPVAGRPVELPANYGNAWRNDRGEYIVSVNGLFNPNESLDGTWTRLDPVP